MLRWQDGGQGGELVEGPQLVAAWEGTWNLWERSCSRWVPPLPSGLPPQL